jgi:hypothetical protein
MALSGAPAMSSLLKTAVTHIIKFNASAEEKQKNTTG